MKKILWATDFSTHARDAGRQALECAACSEGPIDVLTVVAPDELEAPALDVPDPFIPEDAVHEAERQLEDENADGIRAELAAEASFLTDAGVGVSLHVRAGVPADEIVRAAAELGTTLIVMGSHGRRSIEELLLGSTVEGVTKHARCPVLVVR